MATMRGAKLALAAMLVLTASAWAVGEDANDKAKELRAKALKLNEITGDDAATAKALELFKDKEGTKKLLEVAVKMAKEKEQPFNVNATSILARVAAAMKQYDISERFYRINLNQALKLQSAPKIGKAYDGLTAILFENKKYADSQKVCQEFMELEVDKQLDEDLEGYKLRVLRRMIRCMVRQNEVDKAKDILDRLIKAQPENWLNLELKASILREINDFEGAAKVYQTILERIDKDDRLTKDEKQDFTAEINYTLSGVYLELNQIDKAANILQALLKDEPYNPTYNNDLGYVWADHDKNIDEAEKLIRKALAEDHWYRVADHYGWLERDWAACTKEKLELKPEDDKDNASYVDSLGWVLFKKKQYKEAKKYLEKAVMEEEGKHVEIYDHLGEACWALGEKKEAIEAWKKGIEVAGESKREQTKKTELEKKVKEKAKD
jgi:pentatricopeptide repeat protein